MLKMNVDKSSYEEIVGDLDSETRKSVEEWHTHLQNKIAENGLDDNDKRKSAQIMLKLMEQTPQRPFNIRRRAVLIGSFARYDLGHKLNDILIVAKDIEKMNENNVRSEFAQKWQTLRKNLMDYFAAADISD